MSYFQVPKTYTTLIPTFLNVPESTSSFVGRHVYGIISSLLVDGWLLTAAHHSLTFALDDITSLPEISKAFTHAIE